jgi:hypothetical protein
MTKRKPCSTMRKRAPFMPNVRCWTKNNASRNKRSKILASPLRWMRRAACGAQGAADSARDRHLPALMLSRLGDYDGANAAFIDAIARATAALGAKHSSVAQMHNDYATQLIAQMRSKEAEVEVRLALDARIKRLGENHPAIAETL